MIRIATAECFTHGKIGREIHAFSRGYPLNYPLTLDPEKYKLSLVAGLFIPTLSGVRNILKINPLTPTEVLDDIKIYDQEADETMALNMAMAVKRITGSDIGIGTTAGIGTGGIALVSNEFRLLTSSGVHADLRTSEPPEILKRQEAGINKALQLLESYLKDDIHPVKSGQTLKID